VSVAGRTLQESFRLNRKAQRFFDWPHRLQKRDAVLCSALMHTGHSRFERFVNV